jgi:two-component system, chemotaxis family, sensor kinase CheA
LDAVNIVVLQADGRQFGLVVDEINDTEEIVVKPLGKHLKGLSCFAGATIMGDGRVALIIDVLGAAQRANVVSEIRDGTRAHAATGPDTQATDRQQWLLFTIGEDGRMAVPLSAVARLEEISLDSVERAGTHDVVQYRGQIMPLVKVSEALNLRGVPPRDPMQVIVHTRDGRSIGLVVNEILDVVEQPVQTGRSSVRGGLQGTAVIQQRVTDLIDVQELVAAAGHGTTAEFAAMEA